MLSLGASKRVVIVGGGVALEALLRSHSKGRLRTVPLGWTMVLVAIFAVVGNAFVDINHKLWSTSVIVLAVSYVGVTNIILPIILGKEKS